MSNVRFDKLNIKKQNYYVTVSGFAFAFTLIALIWKPDFIYFGFVTLVYGQVGWIINTIFNKLVNNKESRQWIVLVFELFIFSLWFYVMLNIFYWLELKVLS
jgi:hypothetical protein